jgi:hypothetical protein
MDFATGEGDVAKRSAEGFQPRGGVGGSVTPANGRVRAILGLVARFDGAAQMVSQFLAVLDEGVDGPMDGRGNRLLGMFPRRGRSHILPAPVGGLFQFVGDELHLGLDLSGPLRVAELARLFELRL